MASTSETGHVKNVANFETIISFCNGYGATYNPVKVSIQLAGLITLHGTAKVSINSVTNANTTSIKAINARQIEFEPIQSLATRIVNALSATDASDELVEDAKTINRKIRGSRKGGSDTPATPPPPGAPGKSSVSQLSFDSIVDNFKKLVALAASEPSYTPNEVDLQVATLNTLSNTLEGRNTDVKNADTDLSNSRIQRNEILYTPKTGLYDIAQEVKKYIKSVFGAGSPQYSQVSKIKFTKPGK